MSSAYPSQARDRGQWIVAQRGARNRLDPSRPYAFVLEQERADAGTVVDVATIFLTNRECPWRCLMCDLWKNTLTTTVPIGSIPAQINWALDSIGEGTTSPTPGSGSEAGGQGCPRRNGPRHLKLYNNGSFFDPRAIPPEDYAAIAECARGFERVIVECHPVLVSESVVKFRDRLVGSKLEIAMGLETVHPEVLDRLNKQMTLDQFSRAAMFLRDHDIALRVFILVKPPFLDEEEGLRWAKRSVDFAFDCGATVASLIPTRFGNGALEALAARGDFSPPRLATLEAALDYGVARPRGRVFADLWDLAKFSQCDHCLGARRERLLRTNLLQAIQPAVPCSQCR